MALDGELLAQALATSAAAEMERDNQPTARAQLKLAIAAARGASLRSLRHVVGRAKSVDSTDGGSVSELAIGDLREAAVQLAKDANCQDCKLTSTVGSVWRFIKRQRAIARVCWKPLRLPIRPALRPVGNRRSLWFCSAAKTIWGLAYLSMPQVETTHQLRSGIAVQSFRRALQVLNADEHTDLWASITMNLASALVYLPSSHPQENLVQAVEFYTSRCCTLRPRAKDPGAYALVL